MHYTVIESKNVEKQLEIYLYDLRKRGMTNQEAFRLIYGIIDILIPHIATKPYGSKPVKSSKNVFYKEFPSNIIVESFVRSEILRELLTKGGFLYLKSCIVLYRVDESKKQVEILSLKLVF